MKWDDHDLTLAIPGCAEASVGARLDPDELARNLADAPSPVPTRFHARPSPPRRVGRCRPHPRPSPSPLARGATLAKASHLTGYASEASFSHAFRQWAGVAPGAYRKQLRGSSQGAD